jgi:signal transduction histidine kinase
MTIQEIFKQHIQEATQQIAQMETEAATNNLNMAFALRHELNDELLLSQVHQLHGRMLGRLGRMDEAMEQYRTALQIREEAGNKLQMAQTLHGMGALYQLQSKFTEALDFYTRAEELAGQANGRDLQIRCWQNASLILHQMGDYVQAFAKASSVADHFRETKDENQFAGAMMNLGGMLYDMGDDERALEHLFVAIRILEKMGDRPPVARAYFNIGLIYLNRMQNDEALKYFRLTAALQEELNSEYDLVYTYAHLGSLLANLGQMPEAENVLTRGDIICKKIDNPSGLSLIYHHQASMYALQEKYEQSISLQTTALSLQQDALLADAVVNSLCNMARYLIKLNRHSEARTHLENALERAKQMDLKPFLADVYEAFTDLEKACGMHEAALHYYQKHVELRQEILNENSTRNIQRLQIQFDTEKRENEILLLKKENEQALLNERLRISRDLHDDMGATLSSISVYCSAVKQRLQNNKLEEATQLLDMISSDAREMVSNMDDMVWMINPQNDSMEKLLDRMQSHAAKLLQAGQIEFRFTAAENLNALALNMETRKNIFLFYKEAVNNSAKYAQCSNVTAGISSTETEIQLSITDNGKGFNTSSAHAGNGLKNMKQRADALQGKLIIESNTGTGTSVNLSFPIPIIRGKA